MKKKLILIVTMIISVAFLSGVTYSFFNSAISLKSINQGIASFIFETNKVNFIDLEMNNLLPGDEHEYLFSVTNNKTNKISDVAIEYQIKIKTYHFIPLKINLYKIENLEEKLVGSCDENSSRNEANELICNMPIESFMKNQEAKDDYKLKIIFPSEYNDPMYSNLVDYIKVEIDSWQKL